MRTRILAVAIVVAAALACEGCRKDSRNMSYELHIERTRSITLEEWRAAVEQVAGVREDSSASSVTNPRTGEVITLPGMPGNAAIEIDGEWVKVLSWFEGRASFTPAGSVEEPDDAVRVVVTQLSAILQARIVGDEGETYDWAP